MHEALGTVKQGRSAFSFRILIRRKKSTLRFALSASCRQKHSRGLCLESNLKECSNNLANKGYIPLRHIPFQCVKTRRVSSQGEIKWKSILSGGFCRPEKIPYRLASGNLCAKGTQITARSRGAQTLWSRKRQLFEPKRVCTVKAHTLLSTTLSGSCYGICFLKPVLWAVDQERR